MRTLWWTLVVLGACRVEIDRSGDCQPDPIVQLDLCDGGCPYMPETPVCEITGFRDGTRGFCRQDGVAYDVIAHPEGDGEARTFFAEGRLVAASFPARDPVCDDLAWFGRILDDCAPTSASVPFTCELPDTGDTADSDTDTDVVVDTDTPDSGTPDTTHPGYCFLTPLEAAPTCPGGVCPVRPAVDLCDASLRQSPRVGECITARGRWDVLAWIDPVTGADVRAYFVPTAQMVGTSVNPPGHAACTQLWGPTALEDCEDGRVAFTAVDCTVDTGPTGIVDTVPVDTDTDTDTAPEVLDTQPGALRTVSQLQPGELTITELHVDPAACADSLGEYVEILNTSPWTVDLTGLVLGDGVTTTPLVGNPLLFPGQRTVSWADSLVGCLGATIPHGARHDVPPTMPDAGGVFELLTPAGLALDTVDFTAFRLDPDGLLVTRHGHAIHLAPGVSEDATTNDDEASWCLGDQPLGASDFGSPMAPATGCWTEPVDTAPVDSTPGGHSDTWSECGPGDTCSFQDTDTDTDGFQGPVEDACPPVGCPTIHPCMPFTEEAWEVCTLADGTVYRAYRSRAYGFWATVWVLRSFGAAEEVVAIEADDGRVWGEVPGPCATLVDDDRGCHTFDPFDTAVFPGLRDGTGQPGDSADTGDTGFPPTGPTDDVVACPDTADCDTSGPDSGGVFHTPDAGELVITELAWKPTACPDRPTPWIELANTAPHDLDLFNVAVEVQTDRETMLFRFSNGAFTPIAPGEHLAVRVGSPAPACSSALLPDDSFRSYRDYGHPPWPFVPGDVRLLYGNRQIEQVPASGWLIPVGDALALSGPPDATANDLETNWCVGGGDWVPGPQGRPTHDEGTPGEPNQCGLAPVDTGAPDTGVGPLFVPTAVPVDQLVEGDVAITEIHVGGTLDCTPLGQRYLEIQNRRGEPIVLTGAELVASGASSSSAVLVPYYGRDVLDVDERIVVRASESVACHDTPRSWYANGGLVIEEGLTWTLQHGSTVLDVVDTVGWTFSPTRALQALDPADAATNDDPSAWCFAEPHLTLRSGQAGLERGTPLEPTICEAPTVDTGEPPDTLPADDTDTDTDTPLPDTGPTGLDTDTALAASCGGTLLDWCGGPCPTAMDLDVSCDPNLTDDPWYCGQYDGTSFSRWDAISGGRSWWFDQDGGLVAVEEQAAGRTCVYGEVPASCPIASHTNRTCDPGIVDTAEPLACPPEPEVHRSYVVGSLLDAPACAAPENCPITLATWDACNTTARGALEWTCGDHTIYRLVDQPTNGAWLLYYDALGDLTAVTTWTNYGPSLPYEVQVYGTPPCGCLDVTHVGVWEPRICDTAWDTCCDGHSGIDTSAPPPLDTAIDTAVP